MLAGFRLGVADDLAIAVPTSISLRFVAELIYEVCEETDVLLAPQENAIGGKAVATGAAGFLVILLDRFRQSEVDYGAHGGFIDAEAESDRADEDGNFVGHPKLLILAATVAIHFAV